MRILVLVSRDPDWVLELGASWARAGDDVTAVLCDRAAVLARAAHPAAGALHDAVAAGVVVLALGEALAVRGIGHEALADAVKPVSLDEVADLLTDGADRAVWL